MLHKLGTGEGSWSDEMEEYMKYVDELTVVDGVVVRNGRIVVPKVLRTEVLRALHRAHQGSTSMALRAAGTVWWPGLTRDLTRLRDGCSKCVENAPSQPAALPKPVPMPSYPFQMISSDYFSYGAISIWSW